jgi:DSP-PTPase phosphatase fused to NAD+ Kinase
MPDVCAASEQLATCATSPQRERIRRPFRPRLWAAVLLSVVAALGVWYGGLKHCVIPKKFAAVVPGRVYRSGQISRWIIGNVLDRNDIRLIVDLNGEDPGDKDQLAELKAARERGIEVKRFPLRGNGTGNIRHYAAALTELHRASRDGRPVLIHCHAGANRTGAAVGFYRLLVEHRDPADVFDEMQRFFPALTATSILVTYMNSHMRELAELLVQSGVIPCVPERIPQLCR